MDRVLCIIPARLKSSRLPRKMLAKIGSKELILHTFESAQSSERIDEFVVATDDDEIKSLLDRHGIPAVMTSTGLMTGSDRVAEVARNRDCDIVVNLQGDEPFINGQVLDELVSPLIAEPELQMSTAASDLIWEQDYLSPDLVKVICDQKSNAIYFSRSPIPFLKNEEGKSQIPVFKHMGLYAFRQKFLQAYTKMPQTRLEKAESLEQLRALEHGIKIRVVVSDYRSVEVNNAEELEEARSYWLKTQKEPT